jgi:hypothetical protein
MRRARLLALLTVALAACASEVDVPSSNSTTSTSGAGGAGGSGGSGGAGGVGGSGTLCPLPPLICEECDSSGYTCHPDAACTSHCGGMVCATCAGAPSGTTVIDGCVCACDAPTNEYRCELMPGCCNEDVDCGDFVYMPCVNHVCKDAVVGGCWKDVECPGGKCVGAFVCSCGAACESPDVPGTCQP